MCVLGVVLGMWLVGGGVGLCVGYFCMVGDG